MRLFSRPNLNLSPVQCVLLVSTFALLAACEPRTSPCVELNPPFVLPEGVYEKYDDPNILARENCKPTIFVVAPVVEDEPDVDTPPPPPPPEKLPEKPQPDTPGEYGRSNSSDDE